MFDRQDNEGSGEHVLTSRCGPNAPKRCLDKGTRNYFQSPKRVCVHAFSVKVGVGRRQGTFYMLRLRTHCKPATRSEAKG